MNLRILIAHTRYQQRGGEDQVVEAEAELLKKNGHAVEMYLEDNSKINEMSRVQLASDTIWSSKSARNIRKLFKEFQPDILHVHNSFPLMSPSIYWVAKQYGIPTVQTLHNFRLLCPQAMLLREGEVCEDCIGHLPWRGVQHRCYHDSAVQTAVIAAMLSIHRAMRTYQSKVSAYIAFTEFSKDKFIAGGLPADHIHIKPNFVDIPYIVSKSRRHGLYVGRLSSEKGLSCLADSVKYLPNIRIDIIGAGTAGLTLEAFPQFKLHGWKPSNEVYDAMHSAAYLIVPSICYETFGLIVIEAFACGLPVIASSIGALAELVEDGQTGLLFEPGSSVSLAEKIAWAESHPKELVAMGKQARKVYDAKYSPQTNYDLLMSIYQSTLV